MLDPLYTEVLYWLIHDVFTIVLIFLGRFWGNIEYLAFVALCLARTAAASHDATAGRPTGVTARVVRAHHGCFVLTTREALLDWNCAVHSCYIVALVAIVGSSDVS